MSRLLRIASVIAVVGLSACSDGDDSSTQRVNEPVVVVTYSALASVVADVVGDAARVEVIVPNGTDPHDFEPSAKDIETMSSAAAVVANGLGLEEGLSDALEQVEESGVSVFRMTDHVALRDGTQDPHVWLDPMTVAQAVPALAEEIGARIGADLSGSGDDVVASLASLDGSIESRIATLESCVVITGHDSLGYFGDRYGCEIVGSVIPGFSTAAEATARNLADLKERAKAKGVKAIFTELGTPDDVVRQLANEVGVDVVSLATHLVPDAGGYDDMMLALTDAIVGGLS